VAQGAIGIEARLDDTRSRDWLAALNDPVSERRVAAERACLETLDGSCRTPIAALAAWPGGAEALTLRALICLPDGSQAHRARCEGAAADAERLGREAGEVLRAAGGPEFFAALAGS
jgi:hydroxymethylbilane synthase